MIPLSAGRVFSFPVSKSSRVGASQLGTVRYKASCRFLIRRASLIFSFRVFAAAVLSGREELFENGGAILGRYLADAISVLRHHLSEVIDSLSLGNSRNVTNRNCRLVNLGFVSRSIVSRRLLDIVALFQRDWRCGLTDGNGSLCVKQGINIERVRRHARLGSVALRSGGVRLLNRFLQGGISPSCERIIIRARE